MKKLLMVSAIGIALSLSACSGTKSGVDYNDNVDGPYASERTVGSTQEAVQTRRAEPVFKAAVSK